MLADTSSSRASTPTRGRSSSHIRPSSLVDGPKVRTDARYGTPLAGLASRWTWSKRAHKSPAIAAARERYGRPAALGDVEITVHPREKLSAQVIEDYAAAGVHRLLLRLPTDGGLDEAERVIRESVPSAFGL